MWRCICVLLAATAAGALADDAEERRSKLPFIADAVGNTLPPPSNGPAPVGSPSNLLTPDRYEFYTFDDSGELVKRLMTLEEIQAIVAAGEGTDGHLVTFASDDQPPIAFNFSQAPFTKVHSVVTNVQNVLKAQMEAQKNNPPIHTPLDTPDVSDSWSLILPTIFGNTGADIIPDKSSPAHTVPETEMVEIPNPIPFDESEDFSKENNNNVLTESTLRPVEQKITEQTAATERTPTTYVTRMSSTTTTTTVRPQSSTTTTTTTTTTTQKPRVTTTTTPRPRTTSTKAATRRPIPTTTTSPRPLSTTTTTTTTTTTSRPRVTTTTTTTTPRPRTTSTSTTTRLRNSTTVKPIVKSTTSAPTRYTTTKPPTKKHQTASTASITKLNSIQTEKPVQDTKTSPSYQSNQESNDFIPVSTVTRATTEKATVYTEPPRTSPVFSSTSKRYVTMSRTTTTTAMPLTTKAQPVITTFKPTTIAEVISSTPKDQEFERIDNTTTITTQSVSPSTTVSSTEFMSIESKPSQPTNVKEDELIPFDVALSMSQIASDLGNPVPTTSNNILDINKVNDMDVESKESLEIEIPTDTKNMSHTNTISTSEKSTEAPDNFVKISTLDPVPQAEKKTTVTEAPVTESKVFLSSTTTESPRTTIDPILFESMDDLLSQVVYQQPSIVQSTEKPVPQKTTFKATTLNRVESTTPKEKIKVTSEVKKPINKIKGAVQKKPVLDIEQSNDKIVSPFKNDNEINKEDMNKTFVQVSTTSNDAQPPVEISPTKFINENTKETSSMTEKEVKEDKNKTEKIEDNLNTSPTTEKPAPVPQATKDKEIEIIETSTKSATKTDSTTTKQEIKEQSSTELYKQPSTESTNKDKIYSDLSPKIDEFKKKIQKVNIDDKEFANERNSSWKLISTVAPPKANEIPNDKLKVDNNIGSESDEAHKDINLEVSKENQGLEVTTKDLGEDIALFTDMCNELAFRYWNEIIDHIDKKRSFVLSPYSITSMLAMMFMGAKGSTSGEMNDILKLDDMVTFNPHFTLKNISDSIETTPDSGVVVSAFVRELYSDRNIGKILTFYKERAQHFYSGHVEEVNFKLISDIIRRRTNLLVKRHSWGRISEYMKTNSITMQPPLAAFSTNIFQTDCTGSSVDGRDGEMYFVVSPTVRQRRLVPVPAVVYRKGFLAGYDPVLDATAAALGNTNSIVSTLFLMPGQQGNVVHAEDLEALEKRLLDSNPTTPTWNRLLRTLLPRMGLELQIPRFSHRSIFNVSDTLKKMGLKDLFDAEHADLGGLIGPSKDLHLSDMIQLTTFTTCGEGVIADQHHIEDYPERLEGTRRRRTSRWASGWDEPRDYQRAFHDPHDVGDAMHLPLHLRPRQARLPARNAQPARLKFDRPFLYFVRHNPSGMILYVGRYNPRLLP